MHDTLYLDTSTMNKRNQQQQQQTVTLPQYLWLSLSAYSLSKIILLWCFFYGVQISQSVTIQKKALQKCKDYKSDQITFYPFSMQYSDQDVW